MIKLNFTVTGTSPNITVTHLDDNGRPRSARPGSPEELLMYQMIKGLVDICGRAGIAAQVGVTGLQE